MKKILIFALCFMGLFASCTSQKKMAYFRSVTAESADSINANFHPLGEARIVKGDALSITVNAIDPKAVALFNMPVVAYQSPGSDQIYSTPSIQSYLVDVNGNINFPVIGTIHVEGLTKSELISQLTEKISASVKDPIVNVRFLNYKVTVMGEVTRPGQFTINNERVTILDALSLAGDMTPYGKRNNVLVTREVEGKLEFARLNLNSPEVFESPYYYLQQNDVVYVEPNQVRAVSSQNISLYLSMLTTLGSMATVIVSVVNISRSTQNQSGNGGGN